MSVLDKFKDIENITIDDFDLDELKDYVKEQIVDDSNIDPKTEEGRGYDKDENLVYNVGSGYEEYRAIDDEINILISIEKKELYKIEAELKNAKGRYIYEEFGGFEKWVAERENGDIYIKMHQDNTTLEQINGVLVKKTIDYITRTETKYYKDGVLEKATEFDKKEGSTISFYYEDDEPTKSVTVLKDGSKIYEYYEYDENGFLTKHEKIKDGELIELSETEYFDDGEPRKEHVIKPDKEYWIEYDEDYMEIYRKERNTDLEDFKYFRDLIPRESAPVKVLVDERGRW